MGTNNVVPYISYLFNEYNFHTCLQQTRNKTNQKILGPSMQISFSSNRPSIKIRLDWIRKNTHKNFQLKYDLYSANNVFQRFDQVITQRTLLLKQALWYKFYLHLEKIKTS